LPALAGDALQMSTGTPDVVTVLQRVAV